MSEPSYEGRAVGQSRHDRRADMHFADPFWKRAIAVHTVAVVDEREKERDRYTPWLHREVQGRVAGPVVQLRFISLFPWSSADQRQ